jgi:hypothetical protein
LALPSEARHGTASRRAVLQCTVSLDFSTEIQGLSQAECRLGIPWFYFGGFMPQVLIDVQIEGVTPLICNKFTDAAALKASSGNSMVAIGDKGSPREQAEAKLYVSEHDKKFIIPQPNLFRCVIDAGQFFKAGKSKVTTQKTSMIPACVGIIGVEIPIVHKDPWEVDTRAVRNPATGGRFLCHRPCFHDWKLVFTLDVDTDMMPVKLMREIIDAAGKRIGLGDFRPSCKGPFGKFVVTSWKEQAAKKAA